MIKIKIEVGRCPEKDEFSIQRAQYTSMYDYGVVILVGTDEGWVQPGDTNTKGALSPPASNHSPCGIYTLTSSSHGKLVLRGDHLCCIMSDVACVVAWLQSTCHSGCLHEL